MIIKLSPVDGLPELVVARRGDSLIINGEEFDFSKVGEGDMLPEVAISSTWFAGPVERINGKLTLTLFLPLPENYSPEQAYPSPLMIVQDGNIRLPQPLPTPVELVSPQEAAQ